MTMTTSIRARNGEEVCAAHGGAPSLICWATRLFQRLRAEFGAGAGAALGGLVHRPPISPTAARELAAIGSFAQFVAKHPDMPADHRNRFLAAILRCCEELREELS